MTKPTLHSYTHCQAPQAHGQTKAWRQRVSVPTPAKTTDKPTDEG